MKLIFTLVSMFLTAFAVGAAESVPYKHVFDNENCLDGWTMQAPSSRPTFKYIPKGEWPYYAFEAGVGSNSIYTTSDYPSKNSWLISPAIALEAGKEYKVEYTFCMDNNYVGKLGIFYGTSADPTALKNVALAMGSHTGLGFTKSTMALTIEGTIKPKTSGNYFIAFVDDTEKNAAPKTLVFDMQVTEKASGTVPGDPTDVTVTPNPEGRLSATIKATAPTKDASGNALKSLTALDFLVNDVVVNTIDNPTMGQSYSYVATTTINGNNTFGVQARNADGAGNVVSKSVFVGVGVPTRLTNVSAIQTTSGVVHFSWTKPGQDVSENPLHPDVVTVKVEVYKAGTIENGTPIKTFEGLTGDEANLTICDADAPLSYYDFKLYAVTTGGESVPVEITDVAVGKTEAPVGIPYIVTFAGGEPEHSMTFGNNEWFSASWAYQDGYAQFTGSSYGSKASLFTGLIELPANTSIRMSFTYWANSESWNENNLTISIFANDNWNDIKTYTSSSTEHETATLNLDEYAGQTIKIAFRGEAKNQYYRKLNLTDIKIEDASENGIEDIVVDGAEGEAVYYDIMGRRVANPAAGMIVIKVQNGKATKMVVK